MYRLFKYAAALFLFCLFSAGAGAQVVDSLAVVDTTDYGDTFEDIDSLAVADSNKKYKHDHGIDAIKYSLQGRYRPKNEEFVTRQFTDNTFYGVHGGMMMISPVQHISFSRTSYVGMTFGKWVNRNNAVRLSLQGETFVRNTDNRRLANAGLDVSHLFNMISYIWGYRSGRFCDLSTVAGLGYRTSMLVERNGESWPHYTVKDFSHVINLHVGFNISMRMGNHVDLFFEPLLYFQNDEDMVFGDMNWRSYNFSSGIKMGFIYNVIPKDVWRPEPTYRPRGFLSLAGGLQFQHSALVYQEVGWKRSLGPHATISYGRVYADNFAIRASLFASTDVWNVDLDIFEIERGEFPLFGYYGGFRLEFMYDVLKLSPKLKDDYPIAFSLLLGPEIGVMIKDDDMKQTIKHTYLGLTGGAQLKFRLFRGTSFFIEPRFSVVPYSHPVVGGDEIENANVNYYDLVINANAGLEFAFGRRQKRD